MKRLLVSIAALALSASAFAQQAAQGDVRTSSSGTEFGRQVDVNRFLGSDGFFSERVCASGVGAKIDPARDCFSHSVKLSPEEALRVRRLMKSDEPADPKPFTGSPRDLLLVQPK